MRGTPGADVKSCSRDSRPAGACCRLNISWARVRPVLLYASFGLLVAALAAGRLALASQVVGAGLGLRGVLADIAMAVSVALLALLLRGLHWSAAAVLVAGAVVLQVTNLEMAAALNTYVDFRDLHFALDSHFLKGSVSRLSFPGYTLGLSTAALFCLASLVLARKSVPIRSRYLAAAVVACLAGLFSLSAGSSDWETSNLLWLSLTRSFQGSLRRPASSTALPRQPAEEGQPLFQAAVGSRRNVLIVVLEGIPGVYLSQVQEHTGVRYPIRMPALSRIAERSLVAPNFLTHARQTIRGLYSMLSGDYCKLSLTTPKIYEYLSLTPAIRDPCLPAILASHGYATAYLQAADLSYMSKDRFMSAAGFQQVLGREFFRYQHVPFGWGPDDKAFFEQAAEFILALEARGSPWLVTLLTVGTHHPGAVPEAFAANYPSRREAAVAYLDEAVGAFYGRLQAAGLLKNTLLLITSDESHGVSGQPFGRYWGLAAASAPESTGLINPGVFGLIDVPYSILDYLRLQPPSRPARSLFRRYQTERPILFEEFYSGQKDSVARRLDDGRVEVLRSVNGELFAGAYTKQVIDAREGQRQAKALAAWQSAADSSLAGQAARRRSYELLRENRFDLPSRGVRVLSTGQYLDIPGGSRVTVELEAVVQAGAARLDLRMMEETERMPLPKLDIPALLTGQTLRLSFSFYAAQPLERIWAYLQASASGAGMPARLEVRSFTVSMKPAGRRSGFRVHRLEVR